MTNHRRIGAVLILASLALPACAKTTPHVEATPEPAARVEKIAGRADRVHLSAAASQRLGVETAQIRSVKQSKLTQVVYSAVLYDKNGNTSLYSNPEPLVFVRSPISVARIQGDSAVLSSGPPVGTKVVTVGAAELYGVESGVGE